MIIEVHCKQKRRSLELFFDLVFVFTITQLTGALTQNLHVIGFL
ncbi:low temperature requirement protein A [Bacillus cereus]